MSYDVIVIGAGPGGYIAAIRASQNGLKVACIDDWQNRDGSYAFGGTCLNAGCIPSKALLESSELYHRANDEFAIHGISTGKVSMDVKAMLKRKDAIVNQFTGGVASLFKANKIEGLQGRGKLLKAGEVEYTDAQGKVSVLKAKDVILATGSEPIELPFMKYDGDKIVDSWGALEFESVPKSIGVIGAGVIGLELGSVWKRLGAEVTIIEAQNDFLFMADKQVAKEALRAFKKQKLDIKLGAKVSGAKVAKSGVTLTYEDKKGEQTLKVDKVIVAVGRKASSVKALGENSGVKVSDRGVIEVDHDCRTSVPNVYAIGDVVRGPMLAHKASEEGVMVADLIAGKVAEMNYDVIPSVIYTAPEIAWVGKNEEELKKTGIEYKAGSFPFAASGRAKAMEQAGGFVKILADKKDDTILGAHLVGPMAGELISELVLAMEFMASAEDIQRTIHAHPSLAEAVHEAALAVDNKALNSINK